MKITIEHYNEIVTIETKHYDLTLDEFMENLKRIASAMYGENLVNCYWLEYSG